KPRGRARRLLRALWLRLSKDGTDHPSVPVRKPQLQIDFYRRGNPLNSPDLGRRPEICLWLTAQGCAQTGVAMKTIGKMLTATLLLGCAQTAQANPIEFTASLLGANETPPVVSAGTGTADVFYDP